MDEGIPVTQVGPASSLEGYVKIGELFLTERLSGEEAERAKERMRREASLEQAPSSLEPQPTDEVWRFSTSGRSWEHLAGRRGFALIRDGVLIYEIVTVMS